MPQLCLLAKTNFFFFLQNSLVVKLNLDGITVGSHYFKLPYLKLTPFALKLVHQSKHKSERVGPRHVTFLQKNIRPALQLQAWGIE